MKQLRTLGMMLACLWLAPGFNARAADTNSLVWHQDTGRVDADLRGIALWPLLEKIAIAADWRVYVEPDTERSVSVKFKDFSSSAALKMLMGDLSFALVPQTNAPTRLYVFRTTMQNATRQVVVKKLAKRVTNELLVRVKPGTDIDALAKSMGAKVIGRMDKLGVYLLQFADAAATDAALAQLQNNSDVLAVDYNYYFDPLPPAQLVSAASVPSGFGPVSLKLNPPTDGNPCDPIIGMIDTGIQSQFLGNLSPSLLPAISVVGNTGSSTSVQSLGNPVEVFSPKQISVVGTSIMPTHGTAMIQAIFQAVSQSSGGASSVRVLPVDVYGTGVKNVLLS